MNDTQKIIHTIAERLAYLKGRWLDESQYEDFRDYRENIETFIENQPGFKFESMDKRFNLFFVGDDGARRHMFIKRNSIQWVRFERTPERRRTV